MRQPTESVNNFTSVLMMYVGFRSVESELNLWQEQEMFFLPKTSRLAVRPTQPHVQWTSGLFSSGLSGWSIKLTIHLHLVPRLRMFGAIPSFHCCVAYLSTGTNLF
jgi:hypothetical protein